MWHGVPFARQRRPIVGVLRMCWLPPPPPPVPSLPLPGLSSRPYAPFLSLGRLCQRTPPPRTVPISLLCVGRTAAMPPLPPHSPTHPPTVGEVTPRGRWGGVPHRRHWVRTWAHLATGEGHCPPPRGQRPQGGQGQGQGGSINRGRVGEEVREDCRQSAPQGVAPHRRFQRRVSIRAQTPDGTVGAGGWRRDPATVCRLALPMTPGARVPTQWGKGQNRYAPRAHHHQDTCARCTPEAQRVCRWAPSPPPCPAPPPGATVPPYPGGDCHQRTVPLTPAGGGGDGHHTTVT